MTMTRIPLYKNSRSARLPRNGNSGLWYNKFCNQWRQGTWSLQSYTAGSGRNKREINPKQDWIDTVAGQKAGDELLLRHAAERRRKMVDKVTGIVLNFETVSPFITGLGNPHPIENGFTWHHLFGAPFLPASSVKGLVRDWATNWADDKDRNHNDVIRIFGEDDPKKSKNTGSISFLDAIPTKPVKLKPEIMTPHYGDYYQSAVESPVTPGDWLSPMPIPFPAVAEKQEFQFALVNRCGKEHETDITTVRDWLIAALQTVGAGGKTAVGYGTFRQTGTELPREERWRLQLEQIQPEDIVNSFSRNWGKTKKTYGPYLPCYIALIREIHGNAIRGWKNSSKQNEQKAYKKIFSES